MQLDDSENPTVMEKLIEALGGEAVVSPYRNECCGGYIALEDADSAKKKSLSITENAKKMGEYFMNKLKNLPKVKEVRGKGLLVGVEFEDGLSSRSSVN
jgi:4-aminobutyrate aminotransferase-like enzyme